MGNHHGKKKHDLGVTGHALFNDAIEINDAYVGAGGGGGGGGTPALRIKGIRDSLLAEGYKQVGWHGSFEGH